MSLPRTALASSTCVGPLDTQTRSPAYGESVAHRKVADVLISFHAVSMALCGGTRPREPETAVRVPMQAQRGLEFRLPGSKTRLQHGIGSGVDRPRCACMGNSNRRSSGSRGRDTPHSAMENCMKTNETSATSRWPPISVRQRSRLKYRRSHQVLLPQGPVRGAHSAPVSCQAP